MQRVLVVDDVPEVRRRITSALRGLSGQVVEAADGVEALDAFERDGADVVVCDVRMPRLDGLGLLRALRNSGVPVVLHSGYADVDAALEGLRLGAVDFLTAPIDVERLRNRVDACLQRRDATDVLVGTSRELATIRRTIARVADAIESVLITGETGAGKEVVARAIHAASGRASGPFVAVNVCALAEGVLESELFGHERGAFTGAASRRAGRFEQAAGGTILLDEIGDAPPRLQAELLRVVETRSVQRVGGAEPLGIDVRVLAATHRDLPGEVAGGRFREDLWYRLCALRVHVPPLRERRDDVGDLARFELDAISRERGGLAFELDGKGMALLRAHRWPGNARELRLVLRRMAILAGERRLLDADDVEDALDLCDALDDGAPESPAVGPPGSQREFRSRERAEILENLNAHRWNVSAAARALGLGRGALRARMQRFGLSDPDRDGA